MKPILCLLLAAILLPASAQVADKPPAVFREGALVLFQGDSITDGGRDRGGRYLDHTLGHGEKHKLPVVRFQKVFDDAGKRAPADYWLFDGVHPFYAGNQLMADEWVRTVKAAWPE